MPAWTTLTRSLGLAVGTAPPPRVRLSGVLQYRIGGSRHVVPAAASPRDRATAGRGMQSSAGTMGGRSSASTPRRAGSSVRRVVERPVAKSSSTDARTPGSEGGRRAWRACDKRSHRPGARA